MESSSSAEAAPQLAEANRHGNLWKYVLQWCMPVTRFLNSNDQEFAIFKARFANPDAEAAFVKSLSERFLMNSYRGYQIACIAILANIAFDCSSLSSVPSEKVATVTKLGLLSLAGLLCICLLSLVLVLIQQRTGIASHFSCELYSILTLGICLSRPSLYHHAKLYGMVDPGVDFDYDFTDTSWLLTIDMVITAAHLMLPIRWSIVWLLDLIGLLAYAVPSFAIGSPHPHYVPYNLVSLTGLLLLGLFGKRTLELHERHMFSSMIAEKICRAKTEFKLAEISHAVPGSRANRERVSAEDCETLPSLPETTTTGRIFSSDWIALHGDNYVGSKLETIAALGQREGWLLNFDDVHVETSLKLGSGTFGTVFGGFLHGSAVAVKIPNSPDFKADAKTEDLKILSGILNEIRILRHLRHPNIPVFYGARLEPHRAEVHLVLQRIFGVCLHTFVNHHIRSSDWSPRYKLIVEIASALRFLHHQNPVVVHGDLKSSNMLVELAGQTAKILDFGLSRIQTRDAKPLLGTLNWMAPEIIRDPTNRPRPSSDVFSFGLVVYLIATSRQPFSGFCKKDIIAFARSGSEYTFEWPEGAVLKQECHELCQIALAADAYLRPSMEQLHVLIQSWMQPKIVNTQQVESTDRQSNLSTDVIFSQDLDNATVVFDGEDFGIITCSHSFKKLFGNVTNVKGIMHDRRNLKLCKAYVAQTNAMISDCIETSLLEGEWIVSQPTSAERAVKVHVSMTITITDISDAADRNWRIVTSAVLGKVKLKETSDSRSSGSRSGSGGIGRCVEKGVICKGNPVTSL